MELGEAFGVGRIAGEMPRQSAGIFTHQPGIGAVDEDEAGREVGPAEEFLDVPAFQRGHCGASAAIRARRTVSAAARVACCSAPACAAWSARIWPVVW